MQKIPGLKFWMISCFVLLCLVSSSAQLNHYIYLETDNKQPFYIKYNNKVYSSAAGGYLILSKLKDGPLNFSVGFPRSEEAEQKFTYTISNADKSFLIKKFADKGWGLYDLQSSAIIYALMESVSETNTPTNTLPNQQTANDPFANMLSKVTQDSTVKNVVVKKEEKIIVDTPKQIVQQTKIDTPKIEIKSEPVVPPPVITTEPLWLAPVKSTINKVRGYETKEGIDLIYEVKNENGTLDTIRLFIPGTTPKQVKEEPVITVPEIKKDTVAAIVEEKKEAPIQQPEVKIDTPVVKEKVNIPEVEKKPEVKTIPNSNCGAEANEDDFIKLRKKMAAQRRDEGMVNEAKKAFKTRCFSSTQLKNLAVMILSDEWRYRFYDTAFPYVTDYANFKNLAETIQDEYYKKRFLALLPN